LQKILNRFGGFVGIDLDDKITFTGGKLDLWHSFSPNGLPAAGG
jgi:hypothetical protein